MFSIEQAKRLRKDKQETEELIADALNRLCTQHGVSSLSLSLVVGESSSKTAEVFVTLSATVHDDRFGAVVV